MSTRNNFQNVGIDEGTLKNYCGGIDPIQGCPYTDASDGETGNQDCITCCTENINTHCKDIDPESNCEDLCRQHNKTPPPTPGKKLFGNNCCRAGGPYNESCESIGTCYTDECEKGYNCYVDDANCSKCFKNHPPRPPHPPNPPPTPYSGPDPWSESDKQKFMDGFPAKISKNEKLCILKNLEEKYTYAQFNKLDRADSDNIEFIRNLLSACSNKSDYDGGYTREGTGGGGGGGGNYGNAPTPYSGPDKWSVEDEKKFIDSLTSSENPLFSDDVKLCMLKNLEEKYSYAQFNNLDQTNKDNKDFMDKLILNCINSPTYDGNYRRNGTGKHIVLIVGIIIGSLLLASIVAFLVLKKK